MTCRTHWIPLALALALNSAAAGDLSSLNLVPFPKQIEFRQELRCPIADLRFVILGNTNLAALGEQLAEEQKLAGIARPVVLPGQVSPLVIVLSAAQDPGSGTPPEPAFDKGSESYLVLVERGRVAIQGGSIDGLRHGVQTVRQLLRANRREGSIPCLTIRDWPSLKWRAFQDDLTRGPSSTLAELKHQADLGAFFKLNIFTYYMEYQYAFAKHPVIGPANGSLLPEDLRALVAHAAPQGVNILGNQQSFGHFTAILAHPEYKDLRETPYLLSPVNPKTYQLLDDLYAEVAPLLPFPYFNVCCDETDGLGQGPSKELARSIGVGGVYVQHIRRVHDLVRNKYNKRMMMWGDIILRHPDNLRDVPKDTVMLTWGYDPRPNFEDQIIPFARSGFEFFICPGVNCWSRVLPDFQATTVNIQNFVRDGLKHGTIGMLNTAWDDDGESFNAPNWHGFAWGAECAWNGSSTPVAEFNRRLGAVLFGETNGHFAAAIAALSKPGLGGMPNRDFWRFEFKPAKLAASGPARERSEELLRISRVAVTELGNCRRLALANTDLLDYFLFGARRIQFVAQRELDRFAAVASYKQACATTSANARPLVEKATAILKENRDTCIALRDDFARLWARENRPYALDWTLARYTSLLGRYDTVLKKLDGAMSAATAGRALPTPAEVGLELTQ